MEQLILALIATWTIAVAPVGRHYAFPSTVEFGGQQYTMYRDADAHNGAGGNVVIVNEAGQEVKRWTPAMFTRNPTADARPGTLSVVDGVVYAPMYVYNWDTQTARVKLLVSTDMLVWRQRNPTNYGVSQHQHGKLFRYGNDLFMPTYAKTSGGQWQSLLWRYNFTDKAWHLRGKIVPAAGYKHTEMSVVILPGGSWLAAVRVQRIETVYTYEWFDFYRSTNQGGGWAKISSLTPNFNAGRLFVWNGRLLLAYRGDGGASIRESTDSGLTWGAPLSLERFPTGDCAMPDLDVIRGELRAVWYAGFGVAIRGGIVQ